MTRFGVHTGLQHTSVDAIRALWRHVDSIGFEWISIWDHFYGATGKADDAECLEAVAMHAALALDTTNVEVGCLVYSVGYRHPAVLAKAAAAIDLLSNGRAAIGLGAGWAEVEYRAYGIEFPSAKVRLDQLDEAASIVRGLLHDDVTSFEGSYFSTHEARNEPRASGRAVPLWIGGGGERRTLRIAAQHADGWNVPYVSPETFAHKRSVLQQHCADVGRDPGDIRCTVNVGLAWTEESLVRQYGAITEIVRPGVLTGTPDQVLEHIGRYADAGADQVNIALRAPFDAEVHDSLSQFATELRLTA